MASGSDRDISSKASKETSFTPNTVIRGQQQGSRRYHEGEYDSKKVTDVNNPDSPKPWGTRPVGDRHSYRPGNRFQYRTSRGYRGYRNPDGHSSWMQDAPRGAPSTSWRNPRGVRRNPRGVHQRNTRSFGRTSYDSETNPIHSYGAGNYSGTFSTVASNKQPLDRKGKDAANWGSTKSSKKRINQADNLESSQETRSWSPVTRDYFRKPGKPFVQTRLVTTEDPANEDYNCLATGGPDGTNDGPELASWRNSQTSKNRGKRAEGLEGIRDLGSSSHVTRDYFRRSGKLTVDARFEEPDDLGREDHNLPPRADSESSDSISVSASTDELRRHRGQKGYPQVSAKFPHKTQRNAKTPPFSEQELLGFLDEKPSEVLSELVRRKEKCLALFNEDVLNDSTLILTVRVLSSMCLDPVSEPVYTQELNMVLSMIESSLFLSKHLTRYLVGLSIQQVDDGNDRDDVQTLASDVRSILKLLHLFLQNKSSGWSEVAVVCILLQKVVTSSALNNNDFDPEGHLMKEVEQLKECCHSLEQSRKTATQRAMEKQPPNNFRDIPIFPESAELRQITKPFLRKNIVRGRYGSVEHYLDVQYRLLREDFVAPLREGVTEFLSKTTSRPQDIRVYYNVSIEGQSMGSNGLTHTLKFEMRGRRPERWESSKRLLYGSFVCLSWDDFKHILCATVENRCPRDLEKGLVNVRFLTETTRSIKGPILMAESNAYFEAYRHVLQGLQQMNGDNFPFKEYIVDVASSVEPPIYLRGEEPVMYDLRSLVVGTEKSFNYDLQTKSFVDAAYVPILEPESWPSAKDLHLDESQKAALQTALTKEFAIIQGPPGTGKTYIGLKIIELLLHNTPWNYFLYEEQKISPILVVCYTNHALDQFLEGIVDFGEEKVVRVGSRSSSEVLETKNISVIRKDRHSKYKYKEKMETLTNARFGLEKTDDKIQRILLQLDLSRKVILDVMELSDYMIKTHYEELSKQMTSGKQTNEDPSANLLKWLNIGEVTEQTEESHLTDQDQEGSQEENDRIDVEGDKIQQERQLDDQHYLDIHREQRRQALEDEIFRKYAACSESIVESLSKVELQKLDTMTDQEASRVSHIWSLKMCDRWRLYRMWVKKYKEELDDELSWHRQQYETLKKEMETINTQEDLEILREANVIGMTTTGAAKYRTLLQRLGPRIVVVEEAAEVLEAHVITTLTANCQHLILIGDHQQLKPNPTVYRLAKLFNLDTSLFERMINNGVPCQSLTHQHRMRPEISQVMRNHFYRKLQDDDSVLTMDTIKGMQHNMFFISHQQFEDGVDDNRSRSNQYEAEVVVEMCRYLLLQGYEPSQITVLTTYTGQLFCFRRLMDKVTFQGVRVCVVDNYQGEENDIILLSLVRSNIEGSIGFLRTSNRVCVALSRARMGFYFIGNASILKKAQIWRDIIATLEAEKRTGSSLPLVCKNHPAKITEVSTARDFKEKAPCGGCDVSCEYRLTCGHVCHLFCHPYDPDHDIYKCQKPCTKSCERGEHLCPLKCHQQCVPCQRKVLKSMPECGHEIEVVCHEFDKVTCTEPCPQIFLICQHPCSKKCGQSCPLTCPEKCEKKLACGHSCLEPCGKLCSQYCEVQVERTLEKCGHSFFMDCSRDPEDVKCKIKVTKLRSICGHRIEVFCFEDPNSMECYKRCEKTLRCEHQCPNLCGKPCEVSDSPLNPYQEEDEVKVCKEIVEKSYLSCDHIIKLPCHQDISSVPCSRTCRRLLACGHRCPKKCCESCPRKKLDGILMTSHAISGKSFSQFCTEKCEKLLSCRHPCPNTCGEPCPDDGISGSSFVDFSTKCKKRVKKTLPDCGHTLTVQCHQDAASLSCSEICNKGLSCGHLCTNKCSVPCKCSRKVLKKMSKCEHVVLLPCYQDVTCYNCIEACQKELVCGHQCPNRCGELCPGEDKSSKTVKESSPLFFLSSLRKSPARTCNQPVTKTFPGCGHSIQLPCHQDVDSVSCSQRCEHILLCGHQCPNKCGELCPGEDKSSKTVKESSTLFLLSSLRKSPARTCNQPVTKTFPGCGHSIQLPCHQDVDSVSCSQRCEQILLCGHQCPNKCGELCPGEDKSSKTVKESSTLFLLSSHRKSPARTCNQPVRKKFPGCGHSIQLPCHQDVDSVSCSQRCEQILLCGHQCPNKCGELCPGEDKSSKTVKESSTLFLLSLHRKSPARTCNQPVRKKFPGCGHSIQLPCHQDVDSVSCSQICDQILLCGHQCPNKCGELCPGEDKSSKTVKESSTLFLLSSHRKSPARTCNQPVRKKFPGCGHSIQLPCHQDVDSVSCSQRCEQILSCGHQCPNKCSKPCLGENASVPEDRFRLSRRYLQLRCEETVRKDLPCGHAQDVPCGMADSTIACQTRCRDILVDCGHRCRGDCNSCKQGTQHIQCTDKCKRQLLCGHTCGGDCSSLCSPDCRKCELKSRRHRVLDKSLCKHNTKHRQLKSNACILPCPRMLDCDHPCIGVCGETCPPFCGVCKRQTLEQLLQRSFRRFMTFIYLPDCGHLFETRFFDRMVAASVPTLVSDCVKIRSLACPKCKEPVRDCSRYNLKMSVDEAKLKCKKRREALVTNSFGGRSSSSTTLISRTDDRATASMSYDVGRWMRCPQGHVFCQEEDDKQAQQQQKPLCPECTQ